MTRPAADTAARRRTLTRRAVSTFGVLGLLVIVIALVVPSYADYSYRAKLNVALKFASDSGEALAELCASSGFRAGMKVSDLGVTPSNYASVVAGSDLSIRDGRVVTLRIVLHEINRYRNLGYGRAVAVPSGAEMVFAGSCSDKKLEWKLRHASFERQYLPPHLRGQR